MSNRLLIILLALAILSTVSALAEPVETAPGATEAAEAQADGMDEPEATPEPAKGYVLVSTATQAGWLPLPSEGEYSVPLKQVLPDGTEAENIIHLTPDGVYMEDSTCEGHDCILQGTVTLENRYERILSNMIICLPNQVTLQLFSPEEVAEMMQGREEQAGTGDGD